MTVRIEWEDRGLRVFVARGARLLDVLDDRPQTGTLFACRGAHCGTCRVRVVAGAHAMLPAAADEAETLRAMGAEAEDRLACQIRIRDDDGIVRLSSASAVSPSG